MINRKKLVNRHNPKLGNVDIYAPLSVGNGEFVFTADVTGLQSFNEAYSNACPLCTMANWGWHTTPFGDEVFNIDKSEIQQEYYDSHGRRVGYYAAEADAEGKQDWVRKNPHKFNLGKIGFLFLNDGETLDIGALGDIEQELDLYTGVLSSSYTVNGVSCHVRTCCAAERDLIAIEAESALIAEGSMLIRLEFPYPSHKITGSDWDSHGRHESRLIKLDGGAYKIERTIDREAYNVYITGEVDVLETENHVFTVSSKNAEAALRLYVEFSKADCGSFSIDEAFRSSARFWTGYWENGGIISFEASSDIRAHELERRVILSQYLTALQCGGTLPPAETGLTCNSWYGKFHLEMHFWHTAHFALFNRIDKLEKSLDWYIKILDEARALAASQGYDGARWPKMVAPDGVDSPSQIGTLLIWQQPHVLLYCDLCYRARPERETLLKYKPLVEGTAGFMASFACLTPDGRYVLGPPVIPAQERHAPETTMNPVFELEYWLYGLNIAINWYVKLGIAPPVKWAEVAERLAMPPIIDGVYAAHENCPDTFGQANSDHPSMLMAYGVLGGGRIDKDVMNATLDRVFSDWQFDTMWGWDFAVMAMTAARLGRKQDAVDILLRETAKNTYTLNGHNRQLKRSDLPLYLPGNGSLLLAVAMMAAGWDCSVDDLPGFPEDGWVIEHENLNKYS